MVARVWWTTLITQWTCEVHSLNILRVRCASFLLLFFFLNQNFSNRTITVSHLPHHVHSLSSTIIKTILMKNLYWGSINKLISFDFDKIMSSDPISDMFLLGCYTNSFSPLWRITYQTIEYAYYSISDLFHEPNVL